MTTYVKPERMGEPWDDEEVKQLLISIQKKKSIDVIAAEHKRSVGAISAQQRRLAVDYHFNDGRPIEEIQKFTGLSKQEIETAIFKRESYNRRSVQRRILNTTHLSEKDEILKTLLDIQTKISEIINKLR